MTKKISQKVQPKIPKPTAWTFDTNVFGNISYTEAKYVFEQAEKLLQMTIDAANISLGRINIIVTLSMGLLAAFGSYIFTGIEKENSYSGHNNLLITSIVGGIYLLLLIMFAVLNTKPYSYSFLGFQPKMLLYPPLFEPKVNRKKRMTFIYINTIEHYQRRIEENKLKNEKRWKIYKISLWGLIALPPILLITFLILNFLSSRC